MNDVEEGEKRGGDHGLTRASTSPDLGELEGLARWIRVGEGVGRLVVS